MTSSAQEKSFLPLPRSTVSGLDFQLFGFKSLGVRSSLGSGLTSSAHEKSFPHETAVAVLPLPRSTAGRLSPISAHAMHTLTQREKGRGRDSGREKERERERDRNTVREADEKVRTHACRGVESMMQV